VLICFSFVVIVQGAVPQLSDGADQCFKKFIKGSMRRVKLAHCPATAKQQQRWASTKYPLHGTPATDGSLEIRIGNVLFNTKSKRTILLKETTVQICMFGKLAGPRLRNGSRAFQVSAHGKPTALPVAGVKLPTGGLDIDTPFCDVNSDGCVSTQPQCSSITFEGGDQDFCSCSTLKVPGYAPAETEVEVTWKLLEVQPGLPAIPGTVCEPEGDMDKLWEEKQKETLACIKLDAKVKDCKDLTAGARNKINGC